jgi:uncharacterized hydrophobic protein (TIGR00271 family)
LREHADDINHKAVRGDIFANAEISSGYLFVLSVANLIALCGLLLNSSPVIIGAMLISPLMGPILSFGFAFVTGDKGIWKRSVRKIVISVMLTIVIASIAAFVSPLKDITAEIAARTKPNLYDLIIAFLAGIAGASALCTKKNYLTVVPGVAIATAVIPPLSVTGFGLGTGNLAILYGGFLLFFTNFVAIVISTCVVFFFYGFRPGISEETDIHQLKKRFSYLFTVLLVISIPLAYTLHSSITEVRERTLIQKALRKELDIDKRSRLASFSYKKGEKGILEVSAQVNTVSYLNDNEVVRAQKGLETYLGRKTILNLEQVKVQAGGLKEQQGVMPAPPPPPRSPADMIRETAENVKTIAGRTSERINSIIAPSRITDFSITLHERADKITVNLAILRDKPYSEDETQLLQRMIASEIDRPVELRIETTAFVPPLSFKMGETTLTEEMKSKLYAVRDIFSQNMDIVIHIMAKPDYPGKKGLRLAGQRLQLIREMLEKELKIPSERIITGIGRGIARPPTVTVSIVASTDINKTVLDDSKPSTR